MRYQEKKMTIAIIHMLIQFHHGTANYLLYDIIWSMRWQMTYQAMKMTIATIHHGTAKYLFFDIVCSMRWQMTYQAKKMTIARIPMLIPFHH
jgi:hypothetical protein